MKKHKRNWDRIMHYADMYGHDENYALMFPEYIEDLFEPDDGYEYDDNISDNTHDDRQPLDNDENDVIKQLLKGLEGKPCLNNFHPSQFLITH